MSESVHTNPSLYSKGMLAVICAQFLSAFGDNALLFATLALMKQLYYPEWSQPVLQMLFVGAYILFAPFVGQFADSFAKGRVMMVANGLKLLGAGCICFGVNPFIGYTLVGIGAAAYSPAKYGILGELTTGDKLVKANGLMESSTIAAILLGSMAGGILADWHVLAALIVCALVYGGAVVANLWIPRLPAARPGQSWRFKPMTHSFFSACRTLWRNGETRFSLMGTSLFWGAGVTLRFLLVIWVPVALGITSNAMPTYLNAMVAVGIVLGAGAAAKLVTLETVSRCMPAGILIGIAVIAFAVQQSLLPAFGLLLLLGVPPWGSAAGLCSAAEPAASDAAARQAREDLVAVLGEMLADRLFFAGAEFDSCGIEEAEVFHGVVLCECLASCSTRCILRDPAHPSIDRSTAFLA